MVEVARLEFEGTGTENETAKRSGGEVVLVIFIRNNNNSVL